MDETKDQSYFLFGLTQEQLARTDFPLGELTKQEVRDIARRLPCPWRRSPRARRFVLFRRAIMCSLSKAICRSREARCRNQREKSFLLPVKFSGDTPGCINITVGQRRGLGFSAGRPVYVVSLDRANNRLVVGDDSDLRSTSCEVRDVNWIPFECPDAPVRASVRVRNRHEPAEAEITPLDNTSARHFPRSAARDHAWASRRVLRRRSSVSAAAGFAKRVSQITERITKKSNVAGVCLLRFAARATSDEEFFVLRGRLAVPATRVAGRGGNRGPL